MKRKTAKEILAESFQELAAGKNIDRITVKDITDNCGYSPATFYRQFKDKYDLIAWSYARQAAAIMGRIGTGDYVWRQTLLDAARVYVKEKGYLQNLFTHTSGHDSFVRYMTEIHCRALTDYIRSTTDGKHPDEKLQRYIRLYCMGTVCISCEWILGGFDATPEEMAELYENSLPAPLHPYLLK